MEKGFDVAALCRRLEKLDDANLAAFIEAACPEAMDRIAPALSKSNKVRELLDFCRRRAMLGKLEAALDAYRPVPPLRRLAGANMDIDLATPPGAISWQQDPCPWNQAEQTDEHRCATKGVSICRYFRGVEFLDTLLCAYPLPQDPVS